VKKEEEEEEEKGNNSWGFDAALVSSNCRMFLAV
jgi:hypothetical protein